MHILFWVALAWLGYVYLGYPCLLWSLGLWRSFQPKTREDFRPSVSVLISARNEERDIGWKVAETLNWDYPTDRLEVFVASDASTDRTDEIVRAICDPRLRFFRMPKRVGKNLALNHLHEHTQGEVLFYTDANSHIDAKCLQRMVRHLADPSVGCVTGWERTAPEQKDPMMAAGSTAYLGYESLINSIESRLGSVLVCDGSVFCIRRCVYKRLQPDIANDLELPIRIGAEGYAVRFEPTAFSTEPAMRSVQEEFSRKRRICAQGILGFWRLRRFLRGLRAWQFVSRKLLRWMALVPLALLLVASASLAPRLFFAVLFAFQLLFYIFALGSWWYSARGRNIRFLAALPLYFVVVNVAAFAGLIDSCLGRRLSVWEIPVLSRGREGTKW
jgi:cellulose synthase/poly-beta-1,6-N-acetylglucosamine synthase-like glycosyltransferase